MQNSSRQYWKTLGIAFFLSFAMWAPLFSMPPMEFVLKEEFSITNTQASLLFTSTILITAIVAIPSGLLADRIGIKRSICFASAIMAAGAVLRGLSTSYASLLTFSFVYGLGFGWVFTSLPKLVSSSTPVEKAGVTTGVYSVGLLIGSALPLTITLSVIYPLVKTYQGVFLIWSTPAILSAVLCWVMIKEPALTKSAGGSVVLPGRVLKNRKLWLVGAFMLLHNFYFYTWANWGPQLMVHKGATPELASFITSVIIWAAIPAVLLMPRLAFRLGLRKPFLWAPGIFLGLAALGAIYASLSVSWLIMVIIGIANITRFITILALPIEMMPAENVGAASGLIFCLGYTGATIGPLIGGRILDLTGSLEISLFSLVGLSVVTCIIALLLPETGPKARKL